MKHNLTIFSAAYINEATFNSFKSSLSELEEKTNTEITFDFNDQHQAIDDNYMKGTYEDVSMFNKDMKYVLPESSKPKALFLSKRIEEEDDDDDDDDDEEEQEEEDDNDEEEDRVEDEELTIERLEISKHINDPVDLLLGPPQHNMQNAEYLNLISGLTNTQCRLEGREIVIEGYNKDLVQEALERFKVIQKTYIGCHLKRMVVPCIHYPRESDPYKLYFCLVNTYKYQSLIDLRQLSSCEEAYVVLPVFFNQEKQEHDPPKDMIRPNPKPKRQYQPPKRSTNRSPKTPSSPYLEIKHNHWGLNRDFKNVYNNSQSQQYITAEKLAEAFSKPQIVQSPLQEKEDSLLLQNFPVLVNPAQDTNQRQDIVRVKDYNFHNIKYALEAGLEASRGHKGEVMLSAKIGKLLWFNEKRQDLQKLWNPFDVKDIIVGELGVRPCFNDITTSDDVIINEISQIVPSPYKRQVFYEFHISARNQRKIDYKDMILYMKEGIVDALKVVYSEKVVTEIDWASLDRKLDFQMTLKIRDLVRKDVKPFTTFVKYISINPVTRTLMFEDVPQFLRVQYILKKESMQHKTNNFIIEITRVEKLHIREAPMNRYYDNRKQWMAEASDDCWFEIEVFDSQHQRHFDLNLELEHGKTASWTPNDILGGEACPSLVHFVRCILLIIEKSEEKINLAIYLVAFLALFGFIVFVLLNGIIGKLHYLLTERLPNLLHVIVPIQIIWIYASYYIVCTANPGIVTPNNLKQHLKYYRYDGLIYTPKDCTTYLLDLSIVHYVKLVLIYRGMIIEWGLDKAYMLDSNGNKVPVSFHKAFLYVLQHDRIIGSIGILGMVVSIVVFVFFIYQVYLSARGITTNEAFKWEMVEDAIDRGELYKTDGGQYKTYYSQSEAKGKRIESLEEVENIYDEGFLTNLHQVFFPPKF
ncbi:hypothetical protein G6F45_003261 [Rhizopus arrhizus]|nr:hypothetical protein G6F54_003043 [Rhizopus delemar]KAG1633680.1 hypothetical protein G6F45_003261 [Rhizopus arrhizus]KAG1513119.1 hypothetical protein G6F53_004666 [Rhizopus delemar]KAG1523994.1 hypothetical protein G6F52_004565 [Rhizopus delemar]KAG1556257.1 hypothetical protein G6F49_006431 [Rhizopus delemar]